MSNMKFSAILIAIAATALWIVAVVVAFFNGDNEGWIDAGVILYIVSLIPMLIESKTERRAR